MRKTIQVTKEVYERLSRLKKERSFDDFLGEVSLYLEQTGLSVGGVKEPIRELVEKQSSRVIEVIRGIEKKQMSVFRDMLERLSFLRSDSPSHSTLSEEENKYIEDLIALNQEQQANIERLNSELRQLRDKSEFSPRSVGVSASLTEEQQEDLLQQLTQFKRKMTPDTFDKSKLYISSGDFKVISDALERTIKKYGVTGT